MNTIFRRISMLLEGNPGEGYSNIKWVCMCRPMLKTKGAYGADQTEKVVAFRAERTVKVVELGKIGAFRKSGCFKS